MTSSQDIFWEAESETEPTSMKRNGRAVNKKSKNDSKNRVNKTNTEVSNVTKTDTEKAKIVKSQEVIGDTGVTLKDLNQEDKQKIAQLIHELAKVGEEKENIVHALNDERQKFFTQVREMEEEKRTLMNKQHFLAEEVKQCQTLLQYYQNLITMQQTSLMAKDESKSHQNSFSSANLKDEKRNDQYSEYITTTSADDAATQSDEIRVNEADGPSSANSSVTEDDILHMSDRQYKVFLKRKKDKLVKEQESLRKLLLLKESSESEYDRSPTSPIRNFVNKSTSPVSAIIKRSIPMQTLSPIALNRSSASHVSPRRSTSNRSHNSSHSSTRLRNATSQDRTIPLLSQDLSSDSLRELTHSATKSLFMQESNMATLPNDVANAFSENTINCDDSQILQDIFFVV